MKKQANTRGLGIQSFLRGLLILAVLLNSLAMPFQTPVAFAAGTACVTSGPLSNAYTVTPCITAPASGATVTGAQTITATYSTTGANPGVAKLIFYLGGQYLITDYQTPYTFSLPSTKFVDGTYALEVEALMKDGFTSQRASITLVLQNGIHTPPVNTNSFTPTSGTTPAAGQPYTLVAAGDGADGANNSGLVTNLINSWNPNLFLYLGDVYEKGTSTEFYNWYGPASAFYGRFKPITDPIIGNHEYENGVAPGYFDYWNNVPNYYSYDAAGWHFIALNSNCGLTQNCAAGQAQYNWLQNDLNTHNNACTIAYFHHPVLNVGPEGYATSMNDMWALMASKGVDIILTGHDHDYQRWVPLDGSLQPSASGMTEFVAGTGGHGIQNFIVTDPRMAIGFDTSPYSFGALRLQLNQDGAGFQYVNYQGLVLDSGAIGCSGAPADVTPPSTPSNLTAAAHSASQVDLSWTGSTDNVGIVGYDIYRDGALLTSLGMVTSYSDTNTSLGATYNYQVKARDNVNASAFSNTATVSLPTLLFSDGFESGNLASWTTVTNLVVQQAEHYSGSSAARETNNGTVATFAAKTFSVAQTDLYYSLAFKVISLGTTSAYLQRFRTASNGSIGGIFISGNTGKLGYRNDVTSTSITNGPAVTPNVWHQLQTHFQINSTSSLVEVWLDGVAAPTLTKTDNLGTSPIGRINLGDSGTADVYDIALDEVGVNTSFINTADSQAPTTPTGLAANATAPNSVSLSWNASSDNISVSGYDLYRNGALVANGITATNYADTPVSPNFAYQYQVLARDGAGNVSALSSPAVLTTPADTNPPSINLTAPTDGATVNGNVTFSADASDNVNVDHVDFLVNGAVVGTIGDGGPYTLTWDSTTLPDGTLAVVSAQAFDSSTNSTTSNSSSITVNNAGVDTTPPTLPGSFSATAAGASRVDLSWTASNDNIGVSGYDIFRDGALLTTITPATNYSDSAVVVGTTYQYQVQARDAAGNVSGLTAAASATVPGVLFTDGFENGNLSQWTNNGLAVQQQAVLEGSYAVRGSSNGTAPIYAFKSLTTAQADLYYSTWFKTFSQGATSAYLQRFRTSANGAILGVFVSSTGKLGYRNDVAGTSTTSTTGVSQGAWHQVQTHVRINGASSQVEVWLDGNPVTALSKTESLGANPIGRVQLGDSAAADIFDTAFDEVGLDTSYLVTPATIYTLLDNGPFGLTNSNAASFSFSSLPAGLSFECSLDAAAFSACVSPQALTGLTDGLHTFMVRALDGLGGVDQTPATRIWNVDTTAPAVTTVTPADAATEIVLNTNLTAVFSESMDPATISTTNFSLVAQGDTTALPATVTYNPATRTATLQPTAPLANSSTYVATIKGAAGGVTDLAGNPMAADQTWSFTTVVPDTTAPVVSVTAPADGATVYGIVPLSADATDNVGVDHVDFLVNGNVVGTVNTAPYTLNWDSTTVASGSAAIITARATDASANTGVSAAINVTVANDVTPPSVPANLAASAVNGGQVDLSWTASTDDVAVAGYDIFRDGALLKSVGALTTYSDKTVGPATPYQYQVQARDASGNISALSAAASVTTPGGLFTDRFETGDLSHWTTVNGLVVQSQQVYAGVYAARATSTGSIVNALKQLAAPQYDLYYDMRFMITSQDPVSSVYIQRFKKADTLSALGVFVSPTGKLGYRNDIAGVANTSSANVSKNAWHEVQTHIQIDSAGGPGLVEVWFDGALIQSQAEALGNAPITTIQLGDSSTGRNYDVAFDDVSTATFYLNPGDIQPPSTPANFNAAASAPNIVNLSWNASSDNIGVTGYRVYRGGALIASLGNVTAYTDNTVQPFTTYQYTLRALDAADNFSAAASASVTTPADTTPPSVTLTAPLNGASIGRTVTLTATASDDVAVDHVDFLVNGSVVGTDATAPYTFDWNSTALPDGAATVAARAADTSINTTLSATAAVTLDNTPPDTTLTATPLLIANSTSASFTFTATEANGTYACSLDGAAPSACASPKAYTLLTNAVHTFTVTAIDKAGNVDATPATWTWTVDTVAPTVTSNVPGNNASNVPPTTSVSAIFSEAINPATLTTTSFTLKPSARGSSNVAVTVVYDPLTRKATLQPSSNLASQTAYTATLAGGSTGIKDLAGNNLSNKSWSFTTSILDTTPPTVSVTAPASGAKVRGSITLSATASDNVIVSSVSFLVNGVVVGTDTTSPYSLTWNSASIADGSVNITATAVDPSNNTGTSAVRTITVDNTPPDTTITAGPTGSVASTSASFSFSATEAATFACKLDNGSFSACTSPANYTALGIGAHTFQVRATDTAGNLDATPASQSWTIIAAPDTSITAGPSGSVSSTSASFSFTSTKTGSTFTCSLDGSAFNACTSPKTYSGLAAGSHTFQVAATFQGATDATPASRTWTIDNTAPTGVTITSPAAGGSVTGQATISATASDNVGVVSISFYADGQLINSDNSSPFSITWNTNKVSKTTHTLYVRAFDAAGNMTQSATITVTVR